MIGLENKVFEEINKSFYGDDKYKIIDGHFEIGRRLHCETYYFAKRFFQNSDNSADLAHLLIEKLKNEFDSSDGITLVGFGNYSALFLNYACNMLQDVNYAIIEKQGDHFTFQTTPEFNDRIVIVLPITCTCTSYFKIRKFLEQILSRRGKIIEMNFISVFLIIDQNLSPRDEEEMLPIATIIDKDKSDGEFYRAYGWEKMNSRKVQFSDGQYLAHSLIQIKSKLYLPETCPICFPQEKGEVENPIHLAKEQFLFQTDVQYETPKLIFGLPQFGKDLKSSVPFNVGLNYVSSRAAHIYGNTEIDNTSYVNFIRGNAFYDNNTDEIDRFFLNKLRERISKSDNVLFITADVKYSSRFLDNITAKLRDWCGEINILRYQPAHEFVDNFISIYKKAISRHSKLIYFEDVLSGGKTFKLISDYIKHSKGTADNSSTFDYLLCLVDRTTSYTEAEVLSQLKQHTDGTSLIAYFKLNVPIISTTHLGEPLKEKNRELNSLLKEANLDALKYIIYNELEYIKPRKIAEHSNSGNDQSMLFFPTGEKATEVFEFYHPFFNRKTLNYVRLFLTHEINTILHKIVQEQLADIDIVHYVLGNVPNPLSIVDTRNLPADVADFSRRSDLERSVIENIVVSILSTPPFIYYDGIYKSIFNYVVSRVTSLHSKLNNQIAPPEANDLISLRAFIKRSVDLNSNYIISHAFLVKIKDYLELGKHHIEVIISEYAKLSNDKSAIRNMQRANLQYKYTQLVSFNYFLLYCYKRLISRNPGRAIKLEELINKEGINPELCSISEESASSQLATLKTLWSSSFFLFYRILKVENTFLLSELLNLHKGRVAERIKKSSSGMYSRIATTEDLRNFYFGKRNNDTIISNAVKLVEQSIYKNTAEYDDIVNSVCNMLKTVNILESSKTRVNETNKDGVNNEKISLQGQQVQENQFNRELQNILNAVVDIIEPNRQTNPIKYALFIEYRTPQSKPLPEDIYPVLSPNAETSEYDNSLIRLHEEGLIFNALHGLSDEPDGRHPQTLLFGGAVPEGERLVYYSFQPTYYPVERKDRKNKEPLGLINTEKKLSAMGLDFSQMLEKDVWNGQTKTGLKLLTDAKQVLVFRLSNAHIKGNNKVPLKGEAVLLIASTQEPTIANFRNFMNIEKIRLMLLMKEELLDYLHKQFDNDAFIELLENRKRSIYQKKLEHGINRYLEIQSSLLHEIHELNKSRKDIISLLNHKAKQQLRLTEKNVLLHEIVKKAIKGQVRLQYNWGTSGERYTPRRIEDMLKLFEILFENVYLGERRISFSSVGCKGFEGVAELYMHDSVYEVVIPEIIINMKKYSSAQMMGTIKIIYDQEKNQLIFINDVIPHNVMAYLEEKFYGGMSMCFEIMKQLNYEPFQSGRDKKNPNMHKTIIDLNQKANENINIRK